MTTESERADNMIRIQSPLPVAGVVVSAAVVVAGAVVAVTVVVAAAVVPAAVVAGAAVVAAAVCAVSVISSALSNKAATFENSALFAASAEYLRTVGCFMVMDLPGVAKQTHSNLSVKEPESQVNS